MLNLELIKSKMQEIGLNQASIGKELGTSRTTVSNWLSGDSQPRPNKLLKLALLLNSKVNDLVLKNDQEEPVLEFRKRENCKITDGYKNKILQNLKFVEKLKEYLVTENISLIQQKLEAPLNEYKFIQKVAEEFRGQVLDVNSPQQSIEIKALINYINRVGITIVPVMWNNNEKINASHLFLPKSETRWLHLDLDAKSIDTKFWLLHEIAHTLTPSFTPGSKESEEFADSFAGAVLFGEEEVKQAYSYTNGLQSAESIEHLLKISDPHGISPYVAFKQIEEFAKENELKINKTIAKKLWKNINSQKTQSSLSELIFSSPIPDAAEYISKAKEYFQTPVFDMISQYLKKTGKGAGFVARVLNISKIEALSIYDELTK